MQENPYSVKVDVFSVGVIAHILLLKKSVFTGNDAKEVFRKNCEGMIDFSQPMY
jgi:hypothetical protein